MADFKNIRFQSAGGVARIILNRPPVNVLNIEMMSEINSALETAAADAGVKVVVFRGEGKCFSAGVDVGEHSGSLAAKMIDVFHRMFRLMDKLGQPTVAVVHKSVLGGGMELASMCDMVLAKDDAKLSQPEIQVGVFPPVAAAALPRMLGSKKAFELVLTGAVIDAAEAMRIGLVNRVFTAEAFEPEAEKFIQDLAGLSGAVLRLAKKALRTGSGCPSLHGLAEIEKLYMDKLMATHDANEGIKAFLEKRKPVWEDR